MRILLLLVLALASGLSARAQEPLSSRALRPSLGNMTAHFEWDGKPMGALRSFSGGNAVAEVFTEPIGSSGVAGKRLGKVRYEPIVLEVGGAAAPEFWTALQQWPKIRPFDGAVVLADFNQNIVKRVEFRNAIVTEIAFPPLDAATAKEAFSIQVTLVPESIRATRGSGRVQATTSGKGKTITTGNFRLSIDGLDTNRVSKIEALVLKQKVAVGGADDRRSQELELKKKAESGRITPRPDGFFVAEFGDLVFTASEVGSDAIQSWFDSSIQQGKTAEEKNGKIELLAPDLKSVLFSISLRGLGIYRFAPAAAESSADAVRRVEARLYVESVTLDPIK